MPKISISLGNYHRPTPKKAKKIAAFFKALFAAAAGSALVMSSPYISTFCLMAAGSVGEFCELIAIDDENPA